MGNENNTSVSPMTRLMVDGVFVVTRQNPSRGTDPVLGAVMTLEAAAALVIDDADFWYDGQPVTVMDKDVWMKHFQWEDENANFERERFSKGVGEMRAKWGGSPGGYGWTEYVVQWTTLHITF